MTRLVKQVKESAVVAAFYGGWIARGMARGIREVGETRWSLADRLCLALMLVDVGWVLRGLLTGCGLFASVGSC
jgi:hypothetical protein